MDGAEFQFRGRGFRMLTQRTVEIDGIQLAAYECGAGSPVLFVHGFPLNHSMWREQFEACKDRRVIAVDLRGFGASEASLGTVSMDRFAADLHETLDQLGVREPVVFVGLSMGGYIAWPFLKQRPGRVRAFVLANTRVIADDEKGAETRRQTAQKVLDRGVDVIEDQMLEKLFSPTTRKENPAAVESARGMIRQARPAGVAGALLGMAERPDVSDRLESLSIPTLVIAGDDDAIASPTEMEGFARAIPNSVFVRIASAGHMTPMENPKEFNEALAKFLEGLS